MKRSDSGLSQDVVAMLQALHRDDGDAMQALIPETFEEARQALVISILMMYGLTIQLGEEKQTVLFRHMMERAKADGALPEEEP
jgi:uncharacterized tellurite resistance protein B-like protein